MEFRLAEIFVVLANAPPVSLRLLTVGATDEVLLDCVA
jgi:hypothetical protein